jgi:hypothetical protein
MFTSLHGFEMIDGAAAADDDDDDVYSHGVVLMSDV